MLRKRKISGVSFSFTGAYTRAVLAEKCKPKFQSTWDQLSATTPQTLFLHRLSGMAGQEG